MSLPLDPTPWACYQPGDSEPWTHHEREHEGYVYFEPRDGYEQNPDVYPDEFFEYEEEK